MCDCVTAATQRCSRSGADEDASGPCVALTHVRLKTEMCLCVFPPSHAAVMRDGVPSVAFVTAVNQDGSVSFHTWEAGTLDRRRRNYGDLQGLGARGGGSFHTRMHLMRSKSARSMAPSVRSKGKAKSKGRGGGGSALSGSGDGDSGESDATPRTLDEFEGSEGDAGYFYGLDEDEDLRGFSGVRGASTDARDAARQRSLEAGIRQAPLEGREATVARDEKGRSMFGGASGGDGATVHSGGGGASVRSGGGASAAATAAKPPMDLRKGTGRTLGQTSAAFKKFERSAASKDPVGGKVAADNAAVPVVHKVRVVVRHTGSLSSLPPVAASLQWRLSMRCVCGRRAMWLQSLRATLRCTIARCCIYSGVAPGDRRPPCSGFKLRSCRCRCCPIAATFVSALQHTRALTPPGAHRHHQMLPGRRKHHKAAVTCINMTSPWVVSCDARGGMVRTSLRYSGANRHRDIMMAAGACATMIMRCVRC